MTNITTSAGADSLGGEKLGDFNLSIKQHAEAVDFMKKFNVPMLVTGGQLFAMACSAKACRNGDAANSNFGTVADVNNTPEYGVRPAVCCVTSVVFFLRVQCNLSESPLGVHVSVCSVVFLPCPSHGIASYCKAQACMLKNFLKPDNKPQMHA